ncbi:hypothetical protein COCSUDRAFT_61011 [Coccomyxa subellipsoidea C-169]|uniref:Uncharacterized protein n=1 Tax=Coccomyxa subellipsoidea (strain C-169) TaxID=574566 RepID=I0Z5V0_COCSC|nr:hypothetical protein COCSUDRAFT_61011 [Coccomyxa subellipsoidea C-169]EIE26019.1 hypothetical protein COCSUDRAFT_61011 [Coccomyxa subellipsoidea C-169]|eukprot:XP_005650563.1 hypothetical protein COCSUDRAFT_61011 [Coccomyxa subellipsoidea C-169]
MAFFTAIPQQTSQTALGFTGPITSCLASHYVAATVLDSPQFQADSFGPVVAHMGGIWSPGCSTNKSRPHTAIADLSAQLEEPAPTADIQPPAVEADDGTEEEYTPLDHPWYADRLAQYKLYPEHCAVDAASKGTSIDGQLDIAEQYRRIHLKVGKTGYSFADTYVPPPELPHAAEHFSMFKKHCALGSTLESLDDQLRSAEKFRRAHQNVGKTGSSFANTGLQRCLQPPQSSASTSSCAPTSNSPSEESCPAARALDLLDSLWTQSLPGQQVPAAASRCREPSSYVELPIRRPTRRWSLCSLFSFSRKQEPLEVGMMHLAVSRSRQ